MVSDMFLNLCPTHTPPKKTQDPTNKRMGGVLWLEEMIPYTWKGVESEVHGAELEPQTLV